MEKIFHKSLSFVLHSLLFIFPFFFLNLTQEFFITNKLYLLAFGGLFLLSLSVIHLLISKKISWQIYPFDNFVLLFLTAMMISILFSSPNKVQALLNPNFGLVMMISLAILYFYLSRQKGPSSSNEVGPYIMKALSFSAFLLSVLTITFFFQPFQNANLPQFLAFLKNPGFTPVGSQLNLTIFLGFFVVLRVSRVILSGATKGSKVEGFKHDFIFNYSLLTINLLALFLTVYSLVKPIGQGNTLSLLPPFRLSWFAALEILKTPSSALMGIGLDNFSAVFTRVKDFTYNQSPLWQINAFNVSRSAILQILTETGIFGLLSFGLLIFSVSKLAVKQWINKTIRPFIFLFVYLFICLLIFPSSLIVWFLFFLTIARMSQTNQSVSSAPFDFSNLLPIYVGTVVIAFGLIVASGYFLGRSYASEYYFKKSFDGVIANSVKQVYDNQRQAIILNPYIERFRSNFAQTNLLIANNLAQKGPKNITEQDRQNIAQAIQAGITEGKAAVSLNPQKADYWQNLASIYLNVINAASGADVWTISAYQRAILADPQNPTYRVGLGGVYYSLKKYDDALKFFEQAIALKPDWPNASYNYAWANFQKENYPQAVNAMQNTLSLLNQKLNKADYEKVQKELDGFKKLLPKEEKKANKAAETVRGTLNLPTPPATYISPRLELPKEASPEAK